MNRKIALALVLSVAAAAQADDITPEPVFTSTLTRAQVIAGMHQFRRSGVDPWAQEYNPLAAFEGSRTRAQVRNQFIIERAAVAAFSGEDSGSMYLAHGRTPQLQQIQLAAEAIEDIQQ